MAKKKVVKKLKPADMEEFKALLLEKRKELVGNVNTMENETLKKDRTDLSNMPFHMADMGSDNFEQEFTLELMDGERKVLKEIDVALARIDEGTYGICEGNGKPIEIERLKAIPWTKYSVEYAREMEKNSGGRRNNMRPDYKFKLDDDVFGDSTGEEEEQDQAEFPAEEKE